MKRVFAAIDISEGVRQAIVRYTSSLKSEFGNVPARWERPDKLHLTVKFAGSLDEIELDYFKRQIKAAALSVAPFRIAVTNTGAFVKRRGPSVLWLGTVATNAENDPIGLLSGQLRHESKWRQFKPHITIARIKDAKKAKKLIDKHLDSSFEPVEFDANEIVLYESTLLPTGSDYTKLESFSFGKEE